jgi:copper ion binding protein
MEEEIINIEGIHCRNCQNKIESKVKEIVGVNNIKVNLNKKYARVRFDSEKVRLKEIQSKIESLGYLVGKDERVEKLKLVRFR